MILRGAVESFCANEEKDRERTKALKTIFLIKGVEGNKCIFQSVNERLNEDKGLGLGVLSLMLFKSSILPPSFWPFRFNFLLV